MCRFWYWKTLPNHSDLWITLNRLVGSPRSGFQPKDPMKGAGSLGAILEPGKGSCAVITLPGSGLEYLL